MNSELIADLCNCVADGFLELLKRETDEQPPKCLYHYTSAEGLRGIVESHEIWTTNVLYLNDASELSHGRELLGSELESKPLRLPDLLGYEQKTLSVHSVSQSIDAFVASFCEEGDLLGQWRGYGSQGSGYAIGFKPSAFLSAGQQPANGQPGECILKRVVYEESQKIKMIRKRFDMLNRVLGDYSGQLDPKSEQDFRDVHKLWANIAAGFHPFLATMKHSAFKEEREWRLIRIVWKKPVPNAAWPVRFRVINSRLTPYVQVGWDFPFKELSPVEPRSGIVEVVCGPSANPELKQSAVRDLLNSQNCLKTRIRPSKVPLRA